MTVLGDRTLRACAWAAWWFVAAMVAISVALSFVEEQPSSSSWGGGGFSGAVAFGLLVATFPFVALLILRRQPRNRVGWLLMAVGGIWGVGGLADSYAAYGLLVNPGSVPGPEVVAALNEGGWVPAIGVMGTFLILLYPDGHLTSRRWRPLAWLSAFTIVAGTLIVDVDPGRMEESPVPTLANPLGWHGGGTFLSVALYTVVPLLPVCIVASAVGLVSRFRRSSGVERLQLKWLTAAGAAVAGIYLAAMTITLLNDVAPSSRTWLPPAFVSALQIGAILSFFLLPAAIGFAILRYRLFDIDVVINRTLVYGALTTMLVGVYVGSVLLLQFVLDPITSGSSLAVAGSTLAVAALFRPARTRIQAAVDRRFYRARYDAVRTVEAFVTQLRREFDLEAVASDLRRVAEETVQPTAVSLWLRR